MKMRLAIVALLSSSLSWALPMQYMIDLNFAQGLVEQTMQTCQKLSRPAAVVVLDHSGQLIASQRHETVGPHNLTAARKKAYTAFSSKTATLNFMRQAQSNPDSKNLSDFNELLLLGGGVPIYYKQQLIGALGVAGAGGSEQDHTCAHQALHQVINKP